jgi:signal transduction histidine kinase
VRWRLFAWVSAGALLWVDAVAGGDLAGSTPGLLVVAALAVVAGLRSRLLPLVATGAATAALLTWADQIGSPGRFAIANDGVFYAVTVFAPALVGWLIGQRNRQVAILMRQRQELEVRRRAAAQLARLEEQEHVGRRIDLALAGRFRDIVTSAERLTAPNRDARDEEVRDGLASIESGARDALAELRGLLGELHAATPASRDESASLVASASPRRRIDLLDVLLVLATVPLAIETSLSGHRGPRWLNISLSLAQGTTLPLLRRRPVMGVVALLAVAEIQTVLLTPLPPTVSWLLPGLIAAFLIGLARNRSTAAIGLVVMLAGVGALTLSTPAGHRSPAGLVPSLVIGALSWAAGRVVAGRDRRTRELRVIADELVRTADHEERLAAIAHRAEIAREVHDVGAHALTVVCLQAGAAQAWWTRDPDRALAALNTVVAYTEETLTRLGRSLGRPVADGAAGAPTTADFATLAQLSRAVGLSVDLTVTGELHDATDELAWAAYRIVQEALTNAARHAGPTTVHVYVGVDGNVLEVRIADSGRDPNATDTVVATTGAGLGLRGMRERVTALRGELSAGPAGSGFQVVARLPV